MPVPRDVVGIDRVDAVLRERRKQALDRAGVLGLRVRLPELPDLVDLGRIDVHPHQLEYFRFRDGHGSPFSRGARRRRRRAARPRSRRRPRATARACRAVQDVLPGEADPAVHLDRALAGRDRRLGADAFAAATATGASRPPRPRTSGPVGERARELGLDVRVGERVRDGLVDADRPPELLPLRACSTASSSARLRDADGLERERGEERAGGPARTRRRRCSPSGGAGRAAASRPSSRASRPRRERTFIVLARARGRRGEIGHEAVDLGRPRLLADLGQRGEDDRGRRERARAERPAVLLEEDGLLEEPEPAAAALLGNGDAEPAELAQLARAAPRGSPRGTTRASRRSSSCSGVNAKSISGLRGRPSTRSAMMLRRISEVPASIVFPRLRSCWCCQ